MKTALTLALAFLASVALAQAGELATGPQLTKVITGNTVQGSMDASGAYTEFYAADGVVHGPDYKAKWSIEGDSMCWVYEGSPKDCWHASVKGEEIRWIKEGKTLGTGTILSGNPNKF